MAATQTASERIIEEVTAWPGVTAAPGRRRASLAFRVEGREIGHLHGDRAAHFGFPEDVWATLASRAASTSTRSSPAGAAPRPGGSGTRTTCGT